MSEGLGNVDWLERFACMIKVMEVKEGNVLAIPKSGTSKQIQSHFIKNTESNPLEVIRHVACILR